MILGVDYASVDDNKAPDLAAAKAYGLAFAFLRGTYGTWKDPTFQRDWNSLAKAGVTRGAYMFPVYSGDPVAEANAFCDAVGQLGPLDLPPVLDIEFPGHGIADTHMTPAQALAWLEAAGKVLMQRFGSLMLYTSARVWREDLQDIISSTFKGCPLWLARYPYKTQLDPQLAQVAAPPVPAQLGDPDACWIHQFQGDAIHFPGFSHTVDINVFRPLLQGAKGDRVKWVQTKLKISADGDFGPATKAALQAFQTRKGIVADGVVGPATFAALCRA